MNIYLADHAEAIIYCYTMVDVKVVLTNPLCLGAVQERQSSRVLGIAAAFTLKISNLISAYISPALSIGNPEFDRATKQFASSL